MSNRFSVVTIVKNRTQQLANLINNLEQAERKPAELIVVWMAPPSDNSLIQSPHFQIHHRFVTSEDLPIAQARNKGFSSCSHELIFHLDVDCLCHPAFFSHAIEQWQPNKLYTAKVVQVKDLPENANFSRVDQDKKQHVHGNHQPIPANTAFRSSVFGISKADFTRIGGFDEQYHGFGIGDIDFATRSNVAGIELEILNFDVYTQHRANYDYPINHLLDIVTNANVFHSKWGYYPATHWLAAFVKNGFVNKDYETTGLSVLRLPTSDEVVETLSEESDHNTPANASRMTA